MKELEGERGGREREVEKWTGGGMERIERDGEERRGDMNREESAEGRAGKRGRKRGREICEGWSGGSGRE